MKGCMFYHIDYCDYNYGGYINIIKLSEHNSSYMYFNCTPWKNVPKILKRQCCNLSSKHFCTAFFISAHIRLCNVMFVSTQWSISLCVTHGLINSTSISSHMPHWMCQWQLRKVWISVIEYIYIYMLLMWAKHIYVVLTTFLIHLWKMDLIFT